MDINIEFKLYEYRTQKGLTVRRLAEKAEVSKSNINDIENQNVNATVKSICKIAIALEVDPCDLFKIK